VFPRIAARPPSSAAAPTPEADASSYLEDAAHYPGGSAAGVLRPRSIDEVSACLRDTRRLLVVGAQSSLTGGATPLGDIVLSTDRLNTISIVADRVRAGAGVPLQTCKTSSRRPAAGCRPCRPYLGAFAGGAVATCAAGAATFKYGTVREWVDGVTIVLAGGDVLELSRGEHRATDGGFTIATASGDRDHQAAASHSHA
jgi:D-lactate dehydrogenase (cytochrome)